VSRRRRAAATPSGRSLLVSAGVLAGATAAVALACSLFGYYRLTWGTWQLRVFALAAGVVVGAGLGASGTALQGLLRNPLAEPYILGISSGAGVGVLLGQVVLAQVGPLPQALRGASTPVLALAGALATCAVVYAIARRGRRLDPYVLLLSGVIVNVFNGAIMLAMLLLAGRDKILRFVQWSMGELPQWIWAQPGLLVLSAVFVVGGWGLLLRRAAAMNAMGLGDDVAASSGVAVHWVRVETFIVVGLMTSAAVCLAGPIGFVGLIVPHICRMILGPDHRRLVITTGFVGAIFLMVADTFCRTVGPPLGIGKIPVGIVTALAGGPFFIFLLRRRAREGAW
jgi:iron complex transport system permease protein